MIFIAVIVTYNPDLDILIKNINSIKDQVDKVIVIDNNSDNSEFIKRYLKDINLNVILHQNSVNKGIAFALNIGMNISLKEGADWVVSLDQDSIPPHNIIREYMKYIDIEDVAMLTPSIADRNETQKTKNYQEIEYVNKCITSASALKMKVFKEIGSFDEKMFIDLVDFEYCARIKKHSYKILKINSVILEHQLGNACRLKILSNLFKRDIYVYNHNANRTYYFVRNYIYYIKKHKTILNTRAEIYTLIRWILLKLIFERNKFSKLKAILIGINDSRKMSVK